jgi:2-C-methyl-D-erythritol 4-phosphate cytidylyltransferase
VGIIAAAGSGERLGGGLPKALVPCGGRPLLEWSLDPLAAVCDAVVVALPRGTSHDLADTAASTVAGGASRSESVLRAAQSVAGASAYVVHDAARPLVTRALVQRCAAELENGWDGAVAAARMTDTVKEAAEDGTVLRTLDRSVLWAIQTPQAFRADALLGALRAARERLAEATDDASLVEEAGGRVRLVEAPPDNIKVTTTADLAAAEALLATRPGRL